MQVPPPSSSSFHRRRPRARNSGNAPGDVYIVAVLAKCFETGLRERERETRRSFRRDINNRVSFSWILFVPRVSSPFEHNKLSSDVQLSRGTSKSGTNALSLSLSLFSTHTRTLEPFAFRVCHLSSVPFCSCVLPGSDGKSSDAESRTKKRIIRYLLYVPLLTKSLIASTHTHTHTPTHFFHVQQRKFISEITLGGLTRFFVAVQFLVFAFCGDNISLVVTDIIRERLRSGQLIFSQM